jgi:hypothetical protein
MNDLKVLAGDVLASFTKSDARVVLYFPIIVVLVFFYHTNSRMGS